MVVLPTVQPQSPLTPGLRSGVSSPPTHAPDDDIPDFQEVDGREQYYITKEREFNATADMLSDVQSAFQDMRNAVHNQRSGNPLQGSAQQMADVVHHQDQVLVQTFSKFDACALFLNQQPKRQLGGGENLRLEIKKLKYNLTVAEDKIADLNVDLKDLHDAKDQMEEELNKLVGKNRKWDKRNSL